MGLRTWLGLAPRDYVPGVARLPGNPIISEPMLPGGEGDNINGPSLIRVPDWLSCRRGLYYLYFAHHRGGHIRLAYADSVAGPWTVYAPGTLHLAQAPMCRGHIASPDVHVDNERREIRMYFHGKTRTKGGQKTFMARSRDGITFSAEPDAIARSYFRAVETPQGWLGIAMDGHLYRSPDGLRNWERSAIPALDTRHAQRFASLRHLALRYCGDTLDIFYTMRGTVPESIWQCSVSMAGDWATWRARDHKLILRPETQWEGAALALRKSRRGPARRPENALRDPAIFVDGKTTYLLYAVLGEGGIAIAKFAD